MKKGFCMKCPKCKGKMLVSNTRHNIDDREYPVTTRRYICEQCGFRLTTKETVTGIQINKYDKCFYEKVYSGQDCKECPYRKECYD